MLENVPSAGLLVNHNKLPTLPGIASKLIDAVQQDEPDLREISDIIALDPSLSAEVLKIINSPFYGLPTKISSVFHASQMLGLTTIKNLALSFSLIKSFERNNNEFDYTQFWKDSLRAALACKLIAKKVFPEFTEDAFFLGLLHNIGILTLVECLSKEYQVVLYEMKNSDVPSEDVEERILGLNHMQVGHFLVKSWGLSELLYVPIGYHHRPNKFLANSKEIEIITKILHLATLFVEFFNSPDGQLGFSFIEYTMQTYEFNHKIKADEICLKIDLQTQDLFPIFDIQITDKDQYHTIIEKARDQLVGLSWEVIDKMVQQKQEIEALNKQVTKDGLTGLFNFQWFHEILNQEISRAKRYRKPLSIIISDLDNFKRINDTYGHLAGDRVIQQDGDCLRNSLRESDFVARYGGEEYAVILPETPLETALSVAERLRKAVKGVTVKYDNAVIPASMSLGIASMVNGEAIEKDEMIERADSALYDAKRAGKNRCCVFRTDLN